MRAYFVCSFVLVQNIMCGLFAISSCSSNQRMASTLVVTVSELTRIKKPYRAIRDRGVSVKSEAVRVIKARDLIRACLLQAEALKHKPLNQDSAPDAIVLRMSLLPVLMEFAHQVTLRGKDEASWRSISALVLVARERYRSAWRANAPDSHKAVSSASTIEWAQGLLEVLPEVERSLQEALHELRDRW